MPIVWATRGLHHTPRPMTSTQPTRLLLSVKARRLVISVPFVCLPNVFADLSCKRFFSAKGLRKALWMDCCHKCLSARTAWV